MRGRPRRHPHRVEAPVHCLLRQYWFHGEQFLVSVLDEAGLMSTRLCAAFFWLTRLWA